VTLITNIPQKIPKSQKLVKFDNTVSQHYIARRPGAVTSMTLCVWPKYILRMKTALATAFEIPRYGIIMNNYCSKEGIAPDNKLHFG
jgi:hypothetical protein